MEKDIVDERTGLTYELVEDYYLIAGRTSRRNHWIYGAGCVPVI